jgi:F0F1-type ATP synthase assembly protein I
MDEKAKTTTTPAALFFVAVGSTIVGSIIFGLLLGLWLDGVAGTSPLFLLLGLLLGIGGAAAALVRAGTVRNSTNATEASNNE